MDYHELPCFAFICMLVCCVCKRHSLCLVGLQFLLYDILHVVVTYNISISIIKEFHNATIFRDIIALIFNA